MQVQLAHKFSKQEAISRVKAAVEQGRKQAADQVEIHDEHWDGDTFHFDVTAQGQRISGTVEVKDTEFDIYAKLPLMLRMFEGKIEKAIKEQAAQMLG